MQYPEKPNLKTEAQRELASRELSRRKLLPFVQRFNPQYEAGWVHKDISARLEKFQADVIAKKSPRLMLFMPPRHGKSELASRCFPAWHLGKYPKDEIIACSYSGSLAITFSRRVRGIMREDYYTPLFPESVLDPESQSAESWMTTEGGGYTAAGVGGGITGRGCRIAIIDDPVRNREAAESETVQDTVIGWYTSTLYTRLAPGGGILVIMTRWHDNDLGGWLLTEAERGGDKWEVVKYPAIADEDESFRKKGDALHPARYPLKELMRIRRAVGVHDWSALYQQEPITDEGAFFKRGMIQYYDTTTVDHDRMTIYTAWDLAIGKKERNDWSVGIVAGIDEFDNMFILGVERGRWDGGELVEKILDLYEAWKPQIVGIEKGHIEMAVGPFLEKRIRERHLYEMYIQQLKTGRRDKEARARAIQGRMQQGKVYFPRNIIWSDLLIGEMLRFPNGVFDDQVDALAWIGQMMAEFYTFKEKPEAPPPSWKDKLAAIYRGGKHKSAMSA